MLGLLFVSFVYFPVAKDSLSGVWPRLLADGL